MSIIVLLVFVILAGLLYFGILPAILMGIYSIISSAVASFVSYIQGSPTLLRGIFKGAIHAIAGLSALAVIILVLKGLAFLGFIVAFDILTPPYGFDIETLFAVPMAGFFQKIWGWSIALALGAAYATVFLVAAGYIVLWWYVLRKL